MCSPGLVTGPSGSWSSPSVAPGSHWLRQALLPSNLQLCARSHLDSRPGLHRSVSPPFSYQTNPNIGSNLNSSKSRCDSASVSAANVIPAAFLNSARPSISSHLLAPTFPSSWAQSAHQSSRTSLSLPCTRLCGLGITFSGAILFIISAGRPYVRLPCRSISSPFTWQLLPSLSRDYPSLPPNSHPCNFWGCRAVAAVGEAKNHTHTIETPNRTTA